MVISLIKGEGKIFLENNILKIEGVFKTEKKCLEDTLSKIKEAIHSKNIQKVEVRVEWFDTSYSNFFVRLFNQLKKGSQVNWYCYEDDQEMIESGEEFKSNCRRKFPKDKFKIIVE